MDSSREWVLDRTAQVLECDRGEFSESSRWVEDLDADSVDLIEIANGAEAEYDIVLDEADLYDVSTVGELVALIDRVRQSG